MSLGLLALGFNPTRNILVRFAACQCGGATASLLPSPPGPVSHIGCCWMKVLHAHQMTMMYVVLLLGDQTEAGRQQGHMFIQLQAVCC